MLCVKRLEQHWIGAIQIWRLILASRNIVYVSHFHVVWSVFAVVFLTLIQIQFIIISSSILFTINSLEKKKKLFIQNTIYNSCRFKKHLI